MDNEYNKLRKGGDVKMDFFKNFSEKFFGTAENISKKTDEYIEIGEIKFDLKLLEREINERKFLLGVFIYEWYSNRDLDIREIPRICNEIKEKEKEMAIIQGKMKKFKVNE